VRQISALVTIPCVQLDLLFREEIPSRKRDDVLIVATRIVPVQYVRNRRAKHYILRLRDDGSVRLTVPAFGSKREALAFANTRLDWIEKQLNKPQRSDVPREWTDGTEILFRGSPTRLSVHPEGQGVRVALADLAFSIQSKTSCVRDATQRFLWELAREELARRTYELAEEQRLDVRRVTVRNQRARWGSCSANRTISLNWRLVMTPESVRDYVILHELMHLRQLNHSKRFWAHVEKVCPDYRAAEKWLKENAGLLR